MFKQPYNACTGLDRSLTISLHEEITAKLHQVNTFAVPHSSAKAVVACRFSRETRQLFLDVYYYRPDLALYYNSCNVCTCMYNWGICTLYFLLAKSHGSL